MTENDAKIVDALRNCADFDCHCEECAYGGEDCDIGGGKLKNDAANLIEHQQAEIHELTDEVEHLKAQVYNLTLYLKDCFDSVGVITEEGKSLYEVMEDKFDGLPGYAPQCIEEC